MMRYSPGDPGRSKRPGSLAGFAALQEIRSKSFQKSVHFSKMNLDQLFHGKMGFFLYYTSATKCVTKENHSLNINNQHSEGKWRKYLYFKQHKLNPQTFLLLFQLNQSHFLLWLFPATIQVAKSLSCARGCIADEQRVILSRNEPVMNRSQTDAWHLAETCLKTER